MEAGEARVGDDEAGVERCAADASDPFDAPRVSGYVLKSEPGREALAHPPQHVPEAAGASEPTRVTPDALMEALRAASRADDAPGGALPSENDGAGVGLRVVKPAGDEDDTRTFVLHQAVDRTPRTIRWAAVASGVLALTSLLALAAQPKVTDRRSVDTKRAGAAAHQETVRSAEPVVPAQEHPKPTEPALPTPIVEQLVVLPIDIELPVSAPVDPIATEEAAEERVDDDGEPAGPDGRRPWRRALERGQQGLVAQEYDGAAYSFARAIEYNSHDSRGYAGLGEAHLGRGKWGQAVRAYRKAIALSPYDPALRTGLGRAYEQGGKPRKAAEAYRQAMRLGAGTFDSDGTPPVEGTE